MSHKGLNNCGKCDQNLPESGDHVTCKTCNRGFHYDDCSVKSKTWKAMGPAAQDKWKCAGCRTTKKNNNSNPQTPVNEEAPHFLTYSEEAEVSEGGILISKTITEKLDYLLGMKSSLEGIEKSMAFLASKYDKLLEELKATREENTKLKKEIDVLKKKEQNNKDDISELREQLAELDQYGRRFNLEVHGVEQKGDPKQENLDDIIKDLANTVGVELKKEVIHRSHRLQQRRDGKPPTILIQFYSKEDRDLWLTAGKKAKIQGTFFNENLCLFYRKLLRDTKEIAKIHGFNFVWFQGGKILVRKREGERNAHVIKGYRDLNNLTVNS